MKQVILIGRINRGHLPIGGETAKNQTLVDVLGKYCQVTALDFFRNKQRPWVYLQTLWALLTQPQATIILSTTTGNIYPLLKAFKMLGMKRDIIHWVVGGELDQLVMAGRFDADILNVARLHLVQSRQMVEQLKTSGLRDVRYISNFRQVICVPKKSSTRMTEKIRFVFMSRIMEEKGVGEILTSVARLNGEGLQERFNVDFYGRMDGKYQQEFEQTVATLSNVQYHGMLDLRSSGGYDTLASYDAMIFPTYHLSEGIAGAIVDAYIAGLPVIASDWKHNCEIVKDGETGFIVPTHDTDVLYRTMKDIIEGQVDLIKLSEGARRAGEAYKAEHVINEKLLKEIGIL